MIDWELWHSTRELAISGSYKLAAKRMGVNPTTIKRRKEALEKHVGRTLFTREGGEMIPTPAFDVALKEVENATQHLMAAEVGLSPDAQETAWRRIVITSVPFICDKLLSPSIDKMPPIKRLRLEMSGRDNNLELTGNKEADIALRLGPGRNKGITALHAANIHYSAFIAKGIDHTKLPWVTIDRAHSHLAEARLPEEHAGEEGIRFTATSSTAIQNIIATGAAKGLLPDFVGRQNPELVIVDELPNVTRPLWMMWRDNALDLPHFGAVAIWLLAIVDETLTLTDQAQKLSSELSSKGD
ncbi:MAG: LysR family transcriptional regulator [Rhizobiaceae bacterium]|nr:LysR family transcriptional regulator [Rhizobiaceae bacterium]